MMSARQTIAGGCVSLTVTVNEHEDELPDASLTAQLTGVVPFGNAEPDAGMQTGMPTPGQLSEAVGTKVTTAEHRSGSLFFVIFAGQTIVGACTSLTVTVNVHDEELLDASLTVQVTVVVPFGNAELDAGEQTGVPTPGQLSVAVALA